MSNVRHNFDARAIVDVIVRGVDLATQDIVLTVQQDIKKMISGEGTGIKYWGNPRRSSRPGEPPAKQRGHLSLSWQSGRPSRIAQGRRVGWRVGSNLPYARILEFGGSRIRERPYVRPALAAIAPQAGRIIEQYVRAEMNRLRLPQLPKT